MIFECGHRMSRCGSFALLTFSVSLAGLVGACVSAYPATGRGEGQGILTGSFLCLECDTGLKNLYLITYNSHVPDWMIRNSGKISWIAKAPGLPGYMKKVLITNKVGTYLLVTPFKPIAYTPFSWLADFFRVKKLRVTGIEFIIYNFNYF